jgi:uncharacterized protein YdhG (YjbR/CyaY superfamily)
MEVTIGHRSVREEAGMPSEEIDRYLAALDDPKRSTLEEMRRRILEVVPEAEQTISYAVPAFMVDGKVVVGLAAFTNHLSYLPHSGSVLGAVRDLTIGYSQTRSALHFPVDTPLPRPLIRKLIAIKMREAGLSTP